MTKIADQSPFLTHEYIAMRRKGFKAVEPMINNWVERVRNEGDSDDLSLALHDAFNAYVLENEVDVACRIATELISMRPVYRSQPRDMAEMLFRIGADPRIILDSISYAYRYLPVQGNEAWRTDAQVGHPPEEELLLLKRLELAVWAKENPMSAEIDRLLTDLIALPVKLGSSVEFLQEALQTLAPLNRVPLSAIEIVYAGWATEVINHNWHRYERGQEIGVWEQLITTVLNAANDNPSRSST